VLSPACAKNQPLQSTPATHVANGFAQTTVSGAVVIVVHGGFVCGAKNRGQTFDACATTAKGYANITPLLVHMVTIYTSVLVALSAAV